MTSRAIFTALMGTTAAVGQSRASGTSADVSANVGACLDTGLNTLHDNSLLAIWGLQNTLRSAAEDESGAHIWKGGSMLPQNEGGSQLIKLDFARQIKLLI